MTDELQLIFNGERLTARRGQSIAGALLASGRRSWRTTAAGRLPRGLFCGIGVCFDCLVTVNGVRDIRACQRPATEGDVVETQDETLPLRRTEKSR
ncbi:proline dehydrogenase [Microlunatus endophyticus]|uniref:Proline dehydrogenase n=1 Tax=Microlunatus endophyticus TaxID=1716077 RepID=A0A917S6A3_9ACTN|nr:(2Fe-2S)-binding protein [Microlunatus endophyticus]GGL59071.1 proline dehydrogenase [Microlunatus endophyticus]